MQDGVFYSRRELVIAEYAFRALLVIAMIILAKFVFSSILWAISFVILYATLCISIYFLIKTNAKEYAKNNVNTEFNESDIDEERRVYLESSLLDFFAGKKSDPIVKKEYKKNRNQIILFSLAHKVKQYEDKYKLNSYDFYDFAKRHSVKLSFIIVLITFFTHPLTLDGKNIVSFYLKSPKNETRYVGNELTIDNEAADGSFIPKDYDKTEDNWLPEERALLAFHFFIANSEFRGAERYPLDKNKMHLLYKDDGYYLKDFEKIIQKMNKEQSVKEKDDMYMVKLTRKFTKQINDAYDKALSATNGSDQYAKMKEDFILLNDPV